MDENKSEIDNLYKWKQMDESVYDIEWRLEILKWYSNSCGERLRARSRVRPKYCKVNLTVIPTYSQPTRPFLLTPKKGYSRSRNPFFFQYPSFFDKHKKKNRFLSFFYFHILSPCHAWHSRRSPHTPCIFYIIRSPSTFLIHLFHYRHLF